MRFSRADLPPWLTLFIATAALSLPRVTEAIRHQGLRTQAAGAHSFVETQVTSAGCVTRGRQYRSFMVSELNDISDFSGCQKVCNQHPQCVWFTYLTDTKRCILHSHKPREGVENVNAVAGPKRCPICVIEGYDFKGEPNLSERGQPGVNTFSACEAACQAEQACHYFLFDKQQKLCHIKTREQALLALHPNNKLTAGTKTCAAHWCIMPNTDYPKNDIGKEVSTPTAAECQKKCLNDERCEYFSWDSGSSMCHHKAGSQVPNSKVRKDGVFSGPKHCGLPTTVVAEQTKYTGDEVATHPRSEVGTFAACQLSCWENNKCAFFHFNNEGCTLSGLGAVPQTDSSSRGGSVTPE
ncbi:microneme protein MIC17A [Besnoitia besnoiti]|uniref:Microneme protein MIC17A n=1 Tax=Besnoitia besnoiti TaxID=94643 RepID=A0A2A9MDT6_BESBE|nr:microneme protein MIC17A [Besnoitia besnoiti]PFH34431.1 microneme protein MIC17A [Besnoitia besnoiti]